MFDKSHCKDCKTVACMMKCRWINFESIDVARKEVAKYIIVYKI